MTSPETLRDQLKTAINSAIEAGDKNAHRNNMYDALNIMSNAMEIQQQASYYHSSAFQKTLERFGYFLIFNEGGKFDNLTAEQARLIKEFFEKEFNKN